MVRGSSDSQAASQICQRGDPANDQAVLDRFGRALGEESFPRIYKLVSSRAERRSDSGMCRSKEMRLLCRSSYPEKEAFRRPLAKTKQQWIGSLLAFWRRLASHY